MAYIKLNPSVMPVSISEPKQPKTKTTIAITIAAAKATICTYCKRAKTLNVRFK